MVRLQISSYCGWGQSVSLLPMPMGVVKERVDVAAGSTGLGSCSTVACPIGWPGSSIAREGPVGSVLMVLMVGPMPR